MKLTRLAASAAVAALLAGSPAMAETVLEIISGDPDLSTLTSAVEAAGLVDQLAAAELITVFAPNNAAFKALPPACSRSFRRIRLS